jgi:hypothetical protein
MIFGTMTFGIYFGTFLKANVEKIRSLSSMFQKHVFLAYEGREWMGPSMLEWKVVKTPPSQ